MKARILSLCLALALLLCSCGQHSGTTKTAVSTTTATIPTTGSGTSTTSTDTENTTASTTTEAEQTTTTDGQGPTTVHTSAPTKTGSTDSAATTATSTTSTTATTSVTASSTTTSPGMVVFKATIRDNVKSQPVSGIGVSVWMSPDVLIGSAYTDKNGVVLISVPKLTTYRVTLSNLKGYEAEEKYLFSTNTVNITIRKAAVQNELDHSEAQYDVGKIMTDFSLADTDGNVYRLSNLLKEKKLVILDFWFVSCEPCKMEFPFFEAAVKKYGDEMALLAINPIDAVRAIQSLRDQLGADPNTAVTFPMLKDSCKLAQGFDVTAYPTTVFLDSNGCILDIHVGAFPTDQAFFAAIEQYLG